MSIFDPAPSPWPSRMLSILRIVAGVGVITYGTLRLFNVATLRTGPAPIQILSMTGIAGILEVFGGLAFTLGLFTRPIAFILSGEMAAAYFIGHFPMGFWPSQNMGTPAILYCFMFLYFVFSGAGVWSIDAMISRSRANRI